jgi:hypothetical protein
VEAEVLGIETMAKPKGRPKGRPKTSERNDVPVKVDRALVSMAKAIAIRHGTSAAEVISELLKEPMERAYGRMLRELEGGGK